MGVSIHGDAYQLSDLLVQIDEFVQRNGGYRDGALQPSDFMDKIADQFGLVIDDWFITVYNEYYENYNPESNFHSIVQQYYFPYKDWDEAEYDDEFYPKREKYFGGGANADEVLDDSFEDEFGYDGKFADRYGDEDE